MTPPLLLRLLLINELTLIELYTRQPSIITCLRCQPEIFSHFRPCISFQIDKKNVPVKGAQVPKVGWAKSPSLCVFFLEAFPYDSIF